MGFGSTNVVQEGTNANQLEVNRVSILTNLPCDLKRFSFDGFAVFDHLG
jgi:hypothetical protein